MSIDFLNEKSCDERLRKLIFEKTKCESKTTQAQELENIFLKRVSKPSRFFIAFKKSDQYDSCCTINLF